MSGEAIVPRLIRSLSHNPWFNLALEEYLVRQVSEREIILYLWQNDNTVVIGKHQNPWQECRVALLEEEGGRLARRLSGGGAVFHDLGNVNFSFIVGKTLCDEQELLRLIIAAVRDVGIAAEFSGRNDLLARGGKFSGNAYYFTSRAALHHGTLLVCSDFEKLVRYLNVHPQKIAAKGITSVRSRVVNLAELQSGLTPEALMNALAGRFRAYYGAAAQTVVSENDAPPDMAALYDKHVSWTWRYGETPPFAITLENYFSWGSMTIHLAVEDGTVKDVKIYSDAMDVDAIDVIAGKLKGAPYVKTLLAARLRGTDNAMAHDVAHWLARGQA